MRSITFQKFLLIAAVIIFSAVALGKGPFAGFPGGPSSSVASKQETRPITRTGWVPPARETNDADVYVTGMQVYSAPIVGSMHDAWDLDVDY